MRPASIVIPVFNQSFLTRICLASLGQAELNGAEILVVDNGSTDDTAALLQEWSAGGDGRRVVTPGENLRFAGGCNLGARESEGEVIVFLNNDTFVLRDWLPALLRPFGEADEIKVTGSRLLYPNGRIQHAGIAFNHMGPHHVFVGLPGDTPPAMRRRDYQVVTGAAMAVRRETFEHYGGFDESYQNSFEDVDLCLKIKADGGRVVYVPDSVAYHWESMTEGRIGPQDKRNYQLFMERWGTRFEQDVDGILAEAQSEGNDLTDRMPSKREAIDWQDDVREKQKELEEMRALLRMRSVRVALGLRNAYRRVIPSRGPR
jgi:O-antigen biosynthesis protein